MSDKSQELKSLQAHAGWKHVVEYMIGTQAMKLNDASKPGTSSEDILKSVGGLDALRRFMGWVENSSKENSDT
jgi:hypothetical protein